MAATTTHSYFVCMRDFGRRGREATVDPEITRDGVIARIKSGEWDHVVFIHHIDDLFVDDVTDELLDQAESELKVEASNRADRIAFERDHKRGLGLVR